MSCAGVAIGIMLIALGLIWLPVDSVAGSIWPVLVRGSTAQLRDVLARPLFAGNSMTTKDIPVQPRCPTNWRFGRQRDGFTIMSRCESRTLTTAELRAEALAPG